MARGWGSRRRWPPPPSVESEEDSLAHELTDSSTNPSKSDDEAQSRGTVDQYPIILDAEHSKYKNVKYRGLHHDNSSFGSHSSDDSVGPATPPSATTDRPRPRPTVSPSFSAKHAREQPRPKEDYEHKQEEDRRGRERPAVAPIDTNLDPEIQRMLSGRRRAPSPYSIVKPEEEIPSAKGRFRADSLLSPEPMPSQYRGANVSDQRPSSARPSRDRPAEHSNSEDSDRKRHHRRRTSRATFSDPDRPELINDHGKNVSYTAESSRNVHAETFPIRPAEEERTRSKRDARPEPDRRYSKHDSPYGSSAEESKHHRHRERSRSRDRRSGRSPRPSFSGGTRPVLDESKGHKAQGTTRDSGYEEFPRPKRQATLEVPGAVTTDRHREKSRNRDKSPSRHGDRPQVDRWSSRLEVAHESSSDESKRRHHDSSRNKDSDGRGSARPSFSGIPRPVIDTKDRRASQEPSPIVEQQDPNRQQRQDSYHSRLDMPSDRAFHRDSSSKVSSPTTTDWETAFKDNQKRRLHTPLTSAVASPKSSPDQTPPLTPRNTKPPLDHVAFAAAAVASHSIHPKPRTVSRAGTYDEYVAVPSERPTTQRPPSMLSHSSRSSSDFSAESRQRPATVVPAAVEPRTLPRMSTYGHSPTEPPRLVQRAHSYSSNDHPHQYEDVTRQRHPQPVPQPAAQRHTTPSSTPLSRERSPRASYDDMSAADLPVCPRAKAIAGRQDWHTLKGLPQLNFCPTCAMVLTRSRLKDNFVPQYSPSAVQLISCTLSQPWFRLAWTETIKQRRPDLQLFQELVEHSQGETKPCPGKEKMHRSWFTIFDPDTDTPLSDFDACSYCIRSARIIFPQCKELFDRRSSSRTQERTCDFIGHSHRFKRYMGLLSTAALEANARGKQRVSISQARDIFQQFKSICRYTECLQAKPILGQPWHFIPQLPELTICPECYSTIVFPLRDAPVGNLVNRTLQLVPGTDPSGVAFSCQLYSDRMRNIFKEACANNDFGHLATTAKRRAAIEQLLLQKIILVGEAINRGQDREHELNEINARWHAVE